MKKWIILFIFTVNIITSIYGIAPNYVTFAQVYPENIRYEADNHNSIRNAILKAHHDGLEKGSRVVGSGSFTLLCLIAFDLLIIIFLILKCNINFNKKRTPDKTLE